MVSIYTQQINNNLARISILLADQSIKYPNNIMVEAVSCAVGRSMYNEMIDISLQRPFLRFVFMGDINLLRWEKKNEYDDCEIVEIKLYNDEIFAGKAVFMRGGFYKNNPNQHMSWMVQKYLDNIRHKKDEIEYKTYNELVEAPLDNPWFRVILLNMDKLIFRPFI